MLFYLIVVFIFDLCYDKYEFDKWRNAMSIKKMDEESENSQQENKTDKEQTDKTQTDKAHTEKNQTKKKSYDKEQTPAKPKKGSGKKIAILTAAGFILLLAGIYVGVSCSYRSKFLPGTYINGLDCSGYNASQLVDMLTSTEILDYSLEVIGRDYKTGESGTLLGTVEGPDIHLTTVDMRETVDELLENQNTMTWLYRELSSDQYYMDIAVGVSYDRELLKSLVSGWAACQGENMTLPQNAYISEYSPELKGYEIIPEVSGTELDIDILLEMIDVAISAHDITLDAELTGCYSEPLVTSEDAELNECVKTANTWLGTRVIYDWNGTEVVLDSESLKDWITIEKSGPVLNEDAVAAFVKEQADSCDTYGRRRNFVTTLGIELSLPSGHYGWLTDIKGETEELIKLIRKGSTVVKEPIYASRAMQKGISDIGNSYVEADLTHQHLYVYQEGAIVFETDFVSGSMSSTPDCVTPEGVFGLSYKTTNAVLRGETYETPVNYWMPFYGNYGMHDATWRSEFGGQIYITNGSHGCLNLPLGAAAQIYQYVSTGFPVICYYYQEDPLAAQTVPEEEYWEEEGGEE